MSWVAAAVVGSAVVGGALSSDASRRAGNQQADAARQASDASLQASREANALQSQMYQQQLVNQAPGMQAGQSALSALQQGLGLGQLRAAAPTAATVDQYGNPIAGTQNYGATQADLNQAAGSIQSGQLNRGLTGDFTTDPSYQWRLNQGLQKLQASAAARGGLLTGQNAADITNYSQSAASQEYQAAYDRNRATQQDLYNRLAGLAGIGQTATGAIGAAGQNLANNAGSNLMTGASNSTGYLTSGAAAQAASGIGSANAWSGAINQGLGNWTTLQGLQGQQGNIAGFNQVPGGYVNQNPSIVGPVYQG